MTQTTRTTQDSAEIRALYVSLELSKNSWKLAFSDGPARRPRVVTVPVRDWDCFEEEIEKARGRFGLPSPAPVRSCYEAGRDGFWIHRVLSHGGIENIVVDPASIEVNRRRRRVQRLYREPRSGLLDAERGEKDPVAGGAVESPPPPYLFSAAGCDVDVQPVSGARAAPRVTSGRPTRAGRVHRHSLTVTSVEARCSYLCRWGLTEGFWVPFLRRTIDAVGHRRAR
jgi:hypothetical protein